MRALVLMAMVLITSAAAASEIERSLAELSANNPNIETKTIKYPCGDTRCEGFLAYDRSLSAKQPGLVVIPEWWGLNDYAKKRCVLLARHGYVAFAADIYGKGQNTSDPAKAGEFAGTYKGNLPLFRDRLNAALTTLKGQTPVDATRLGALGYCFGGTGALELARSGADVKGVVSFHGGLGTKDPNDAKNIKGQVLVLHGADDSFVPAEEVRGFLQEMLDHHIAYEFVAYRGSVHAFTNPAAGSDPAKGVAYNARADKMSWNAMLDFFQASLGGQTAK